MTSRRCFSPLVSTRHESRLDCDLPLYCVTNASRCDSLRVSLTTQHTEARCIRVYCSPLSSIRYRICHAVFATEAQTHVQCCNFRRHFSRMQYKLFYHPGALGISDVGRQHILSHQFPCERNLCTTCVWCESEP